MALYGVRLVINLFDLCIYRRYLEEFIGNRKTSMEFSVLLLIVCELIGSAVNQMGISWLNFVTMVAILCVYVCQYEARIVSRLIAVLLYMGIMGVAEPLGYLFNKAFMEKVLDDTTVSYYFIVFFMALLKATIVEVFCRLKSGKSIRLSAMPKETQYMLTMIPLCSLISCFLLIEVAKELISAQMVVLCMCIIFVIIITNYVIFLMIEKYTTVEEKQHEEEMIQREILYRNEYYQDMERYQEQIQDIRLAEEIIYSANPVVNAILKVKSVKAKEKEIPMQVTTLLPQRVSVDIGDMGVLYGNLLDNAIEAAMAVEQEKRYVHVESKFQEGRLLLSIKNSKPSGTSSCQQTSKKDKIKHGRGIRSVRKVAEKYGGELMLKDQGEHFEAVLLLNGVAKLE
ncbi:ATP-binding protein [Roseburia intestinalis]|uniref:ATP-binding protein n=1 Tax=Roseburia intestinalis TaxID=166486 RepID=UPI0001CD855D|nr:ATP-binding protein [Roseburia intestinalis]CBL07610.1 Histidine kinase-, DNA gyrase B-, and HSP90-like ATPase [Roseburia intestinalis M50/1]